MSRSVFAASLAVVVWSSLACGAPPPDRLEITPPTLIKADELGRTVSLKATAFRGLVEHDDSKAKEPLVISWASSDPAVATVDQSGTVTSTGTGKAKITASVKGAKGDVVADVDVNNLIVGSVEASGEFPKVFKLDSKPVQLKIVVKNEKGAVVEKPQLKMRATDYCVEVTPEGVVHPLAVGECSVIVECAGKRAKIDLDVKG